MEYPIPTRGPDLVLIKKKKIISYHIFFTVPANHRIKVEKNKQKTNKQKLIDTRTLPERLKISYEA